MSTTITSSFAKLKQIISNIKNEINDFQNKVQNLSSNNYMSNNFNSNYRPSFFKENINIFANANQTNLSRKEKIMLFNQERNARIDEIKKQINFLDYIFLNSNTKENDSNNESKIKTIKEVLSDKKYDLNEQTINSLCDAIANNDEIKKEQLLENLITMEEIVEEEPMEEIKKDVILTQDFLSKLKNEGKEISQNFSIKEKETNQKSNSWLEEEDLDKNIELLNQKNDINKEDLVSLLNKK